MNESDLIEGGYVLLARRLVESEIMDKPPLWMKLWTWMLCRAQQRGKYGRFDVGQFHASIESMREAMSWRVGYRKMKPTKDEIRKAYEGLTKATMITTTKTTRGMIITILNFDKYQSPKNYEAHSEDHNESARRSHEGTQDRQEVTRRNKKKKDIYSDFSSEVLAYLNKKTGKRFTNVGNIPARLKDGASVEDCKAVIDSKMDDPFFLDNPKFMNPQTLFRKSKFDTYLNEGHVAGSSRLTPEKQAEVDTLVKTVLANYEIAVKELSEGKA